WAANDQIADGASIQLGASGKLDLSNLGTFSEAITNLVLGVGPNGASLISLGSSTLTTLGNLTLQTVGTGNATGAMISGGTLALNLYGATAAAARTFLVNHGTNGDDLTISSAIVDGSGLTSMGVTKTGAGTLVYSGNSANTYSGTTTVNAGTLALNKGSGSGGVNAMSGPLTIGNNTLAGTTANVGDGEGGQNSDVVQLRQNEQLPNAVAAVTLQGTGMLDLAGNTETIGQANLQAALIISN